MIGSQISQRINAIRYCPELWQRISWLEAVRITPLKVGLVELSPEIQVAEYVEEQHWCFGWPFYPYHLKDHKPPPPLNEECLNYDERMMER